MKLITEKGELELHEDFNFEVEMTNPFLSDEGDSTVPATLPSSPNNLKVLDNIHRIDRARRFMKRVPAILQSGVWRKHGQLIIDTINRRAGVSMSFAIESSDIYSQYKNKSLKEITSSRITQWNSVDSLVQHLNDIAFDNLYISADKPDYDIFPLAVDKYESNDTERYQLNNEFVVVQDTPRLISEARNVIEGESTISVPKGYGLSPQLYLHRAIDILFEEMGYQVVENCFSAYPYSTLCLVNNCSDTCVKGEIRYSDMYPSCSLSEFIDFLKNKFCVTVRVDSSSHRVWVMMLQSILQSNDYDIDITGLIEDSADIIPEDSSRVVLSSDTSMDGAAPAAETLDELIEKYGDFVLINETQFNNIGTPHQTVFDCLVKRRVTGEFYSLNRNISDGKQVAIRLGTDQFTYDRKNSESSEEYSSTDVVPPVVETDKMFCLYIGSRLHAHTTSMRGDNTSDQKIIICWSDKKNLNYYYQPQGRLSKYNFGSGTGATKPFSLNPYEMYEHFWSQYNNILLNNKVTVKGFVNYDTRQLAAMDMTRAKLWKGQRLLPVYLSFNVGTKTRCNDSEFLLIKHFADEISDTPLEPVAASSLKWEMRYNTGKINEILAYFFPIYYDAEGHNIGHELPPNPGSVIIQNGFEFVKIEDTETDVFLSPPKFLGQETARVSRKIIFNPIYEWIEITPGATRPITVFTDFEVWDHVWFEAVAI